MGLITLEQGGSNPPTDEQKAEILRALGLDSPDVSYLTSWNFLVNSWTDQPTPNATTPVLGGKVYDYGYDGATLYRHVPEPYDSVEDKFYDTYAAGVLSGGITQRGNPLA